MYVNTNKFGNNKLTNIYITAVKKSICTVIVCLTNSNRSYTSLFPPTFSPNMPGYYFFFLSHIARSVLYDGILCK